MDFTVIKISLIKTLLRNFSSSKNDQAPMYINNDKRKQRFKEERFDYKELSELKKGRHSFLPGEREVSWKCDMT